MQNRRFVSFAWGVLGLNLLVIVFGAFVRATGSGAGCGQHWPTCKGVIIPPAPELETIIELTHRATSGLAFLLVLGMLIWAFRVFPKRHPVRWGAALSMIFMVIEALVGAGLVLFEMVAYNPAVARAYWMSAHLINTLLLLACITLSALWASGAPPLSLRDHPRTKWVILAGILALLVLGVSGAITALGDMLYPVESLSEGIAQDFSTSAHIFIRLRVWHPILAILTGTFLVITVGVFFPKDKKLPLARAAMGVIVAVALQMIAGPVNLLLLAPVWMQLIHLLLADFVWITFIVFSAYLLGPISKPVDSKYPVATSSLTN